MSVTSYHHGDLRTAMIEKGIEMINEQGINTLSLRQLAAACGVSHAAPYSHFANKDDLLSAIQKHITDKFVSVLSEALTGLNDTPEGLLNMGCAYVMFFVRNPQYFHFTFNRMNLLIDFDENPSEYEPFELYKDTMLHLLEKINIANELWRKIIITHLSFVHGLASIAIMTSNVNIEEWEENVYDILSKSYFLGGMQC
ncbi:MAG: TetR/AcrR family transcriptional regulator [Defluviitaleaceae bacterium]|nr:TetR/AcrR family transcriptional regulator [Defluviitaleaceae bacterium]